MNAKGQDRGSILPRFFISFLRNDFSADGDGIPAAEFFTFRGE
ncbi:hypothetical protein HMPREF1141_1509 [Clostridium sp. MSTE9]|nr:hypothetical protein HMPREF1141_1509 [Clostridium sp. MSTE9]